MAFNKVMRAKLEDRDIVVYGDGTQTRAFTYVDDIVDGLILAHKAAAGTILNIGGGNRVSVIEAMATLGNAMGVKLRLQLRSRRLGMLETHGRMLEEQGTRQAAGTRRGSQLEWHGNAPG